MSMCPRAPVEVRLLLLVGVRLGRRSSYWPFVSIFKQNNMLRYGYNQIVNDLLSKNGDDLGISASLLEPVAEPDSKAVTFQNLVFQDDSNSSLTSFALHSVSDLSFQLMSSLLQSHD